MFLPYKLADFFHEQVAAKKIPPGLDVSPMYGSVHAGGIDIKSCESFTLQAGESRVVHTGICVAIPDGHVGLMRSRSGLIFKKDITAFHGTIDADYRGEMKVILTNHGTQPQYVESGERIVQMVITPFVSVIPEEKPFLEDTERGSNGYGSSGRF